MTLHTRYVRFTRKAVFRIGFTAAWAGLAAGCASYEANELPLLSTLVASVAALDRTKQGGGQISAEQPLTLTDVALLAVQDNPDLKAIRARRGIAQAQVIQAGLLPDPVLSGSYGVLLAGPDFANAFSASLTGDIAALVTLSARRQAASKAAQEVDANVVWQEWQTNRQAQQLVIDIVEQGRLLRSLEQALDLLQTPAATTARGVAEGNATLQMLAPDAAAVTSLQTQLDTAALAQERQWQSLDALLGLEPWVRPQLATELRVPVLSERETAAMLRSLPSRRPDLIALQLGYASQEANLRAAVLGQFPPSRSAPTTAATPRGCKRSARRSRSACRFSTATAARSRSSGRRASNSAPNTRPGSPRRMAASRPCLRTSRRSRNSFVLLEPALGDPTCSPPTRRARCAAACSTS